MEESISLGLDNKTITFSPPGRKSVQLQLYKTAHSAERKAERKTEREKTIDSAAPPKKIFGCMHKTTTQLSVHNMTYLTPMAVNAIFLQCIVHRTP